MMVRRYDGTVVWRYGDMVVCDMMVRRYGGMVVQWYDGIWYGGTKV